ncbi:MAG: family 10 glycosylhydrolase, partial [Muribaculaceae bacterium]|nr:family 10 glycosylhydrolase [Muribaculaceae bacterium]
VSPFGIWRNKKTDPRGSDSNGLQNYDGLYADVLLWAKNGWVDYLAPQLYWTLDFKAAPSRHLAHWWNDNCHGVDVFIGQDVQRTMNNADPKTGDTNELATKVKLSRVLPNIKGNVWWHGYWVTGNMKGVADSLAYVHQNTVALPPTYGDPKDIPAPVSNLRVSGKDGMTYLEWDSNPPADKATDQIRFVVYSFLEDEDLDTDNVEAIMIMTPRKEYLVSEDDDPDAVKGMRFAVTALDRNNRESKPVEIIL